MLITEINVPVYSSDGFCQMLECIKCRYFDEAARLSGYASGMCEECFNKNNFVLVDLPQGPEIKKPVSSNLH